MPTTSSPHPRPARAVARLAVTLAAAALGMVGLVPPATARPARPTSPVQATPTTTAPTTTAPAPTETDEPAGSGPAWAVEPSSATGPTGRSAFLYDVKPGQVVDDVLGISNLADEAQTFRVYGSDAFSTADGAFALVRGDQRSTDVGRWLRFGAATYTIPPHSRLDLPFKIQVPAGATPGDHAGGAVAAVLEKGKPRKGQQVDIDRRVAARMYVRVQGPLRPELTVDRVQVRWRNPANALAGSRMRVTYRIRNTGNTRLTGTAKVRTAGLFGLGGASAETTSLPDLLPGAALIRTATIAGVRPTVQLSTTVEVVPEPVGGVTGTAPETVTRTQTRWAMPWTLVALAVVLVGAWRLRRRVRRRRPATTG